MYMNNELNPVIASSTDPTQVSNYIRGLILSASSFIILFATQIFHLTISASDVSSLATSIGMIAGGIWFIYGLLHKGVVKLGRSI